MYFFFCGGDKERATFSSLLRSWILQLTEGNPTALQYVNLVRHREGNSTASEKDIMELFQVILDQAPSCYLAVDAFDECLDGEDFFSRLSTIPKRFKILATSRTPTSSTIDVTKARSSIQILEIHPEMLQDDINRFIAASTAYLDMECSEETKRQIQSRLSRNEGMFLWVKLMLDQIRSQTCEYEILYCLRELPEGLLETYDRIMNRINTLKGPRRLLALRVFFWTLTVRRPVSVAELRVLLAIQPGLETFDERRLVSAGETIMRAVCGGLIEFRHPEQRAFFMHFTVTQYLEIHFRQQHVYHEIMSSYDMNNLSTNDGLAAAVCIRYLSYEHLNSFVAPADHADATILLETHDPRTSLLSYTVSHWFQHLALARPAEQDAWQLATQFLAQNSTTRDFSWQLYWFSSPASLESKICPAQFSGLHIASYFGLPSLVESLLQLSSSDLRDSAARSPLWWAASRGHVDVTDRLLKGGFDPHAYDRDMVTPVHRAAALGHSRVLHTIVIFSTRSQYQTPVYPESSPELLQLKDRESWTPLHWAASRGHTAAVNALRWYKQYGAASSQCSLGRIPLHLAALNGHTASLDALSGLNGGPISHIRFFCGSQLNTQDKQGSTPLHLAAIRGHLEAVQELLRLGADPTALDHTGKNASQKAQMMGNTEVYKVLELHLRAVEGRSYHLPMLLETGEKLRQYDLASDTPDPNPIDTQDASVLQALVDGHLQTLYRLSMKRGWKLKRDSRERTALHLAAALGYEACMEEIMYSAREASTQNSTKAEGFIDLQDDRMWTALHYAAAGRFPRICKKLLEHKASTTLRNQEGLTAFDLAKSEGHRETQEAIARYAPLTSDEVSSAFGMTRLHVLARDGTLSEADVECALPIQLQEPDALGRTPLFRATELRMHAAARLLTETVGPTVNELMELSVLARSHEDVQMIEFFLERLTPGSLAHDGCDRGLAQGMLCAMAKSNAVGAIEALLSAGIDIEGVGAIDPTDLSPSEAPLCCAIKARASDAAICLIRHGADTTVKSLDGLTCIHLACQDGMADVVESMLQHGADPNIIVVSRRLTGTPLHATFMSDWPNPPQPLANSVPTVRLLLKYGASLWLTSNSCFKPAAWHAVRHWHNEKFEEKFPPRGLDPITPDKTACDSLQAILEQNNAAIMMEKAGERGFVSIHEAAASNDVEALQKYLDSGVPPDWATYGWYCVTPLQIAIENSNVEAAQLLIDRGADVKVIATSLGWQSAGIAKYASGAEEQRNSLVKLLLEKLKIDSRGYFTDGDVHSGRGFSLATREIGGQPVSKHDT
jgi:ankyrin repeat protein